MLLENRLDSESQEIVTNPSLEFHNIEFKCACGSFFHFNTDAALGRCKFLVSETQNPTEEFFECPNCGKLIRILDGVKFHSDEGPLVFCSDGDFLYLKNEKGEYKMLCD